jgi:hypothetical protein
MPGKNPKGRKKRRLTDEESDELYQVRKKAYDDVWNDGAWNDETMTAWFGFATLHIDYPLELGVWPADHPEMAGRVSVGLTRLTEESRERELNRAKIFKRAEKNHASVVAAEPGGKDAAAAAASFAAKVVDEDDLRQKL